MLDYRFAGWLSSSFRELCPEVSTRHSVNWNYPRPANRDRESYWTPPRWSLCARFRHGQRRDRTRPFRPHSLQLWVSRAVFDAGGGGRQYVSSLAKQAGYFREHRDKPGHRQCIFNARGIVLQVSRTPVSSEALPGRTFKIARCVISEDNEILAGIPRIASVSGPFEQGCGTARE